MKWESPDRGDRALLPVADTGRGRAVVIPPRGTIVVSWSEIDTVRQCPMKHDLSYIERWSKPPRAGGALSRGSLWHLVMEEHYRSLMATQGAKPGAKALHPPPERLKAATKAGTAVLFKAEREAEDDKDTARLEEIELVAWMYQGYIDKWGSDENWWIAATEHSAQVRLPNEFGRPSRFVLKLKIDLVIALQPTLGMVAREPGVNRAWPTYVVDHKSGKDLPRDKDFDFLDQFSLYTWALRKMGRKVFGQMYSAARTQRNKGDQDGSAPQPLDKRFSRTPMSRTDIELDRVAIEAYQTISERYQQQARLDKIGGEPPRYTNEGTCSWRCDFTEPCLHGRKGGDMRDYLRSSGFEQRFERH